MGQRYKHWLWLILAASILALVIFFAIGFPFTLPRQKTQETRLNSNGAAVSYEEKIANINSNLNVGDSILIFQKLCPLDAFLRKELNLSSPFLFGDMVESGLCKQRVIKFLGIFEGQGLFGPPWVKLEVYKWDIKGDLIEEDKIRAGNPKAKYIGFIEVNKFLYWGCHNQSENSEMPKWPCKKDTAGNDLFAALSVDEVMQGGVMAAVVQVSTPIPPLFPTPVVTSTVVGLSNPLLAPSAAPTLQPSLTLELTPTGVSTLTATQLPTPIPTLVPWFFLVKLQEETDLRRHEEYRLGPDELLFKVNLEFPEYLEEDFKVADAPGAVGFGLNFPKYVKGPKCGFLSVEAKVSYHGPKYEAVELLNRSDEIEVPCPQPKEFTRSTNPWQKYVPVSADVNYRSAPFICKVRLVDHLGNYQDQDCDTVEGKKDSTVLGQLTLARGVVYLCPQTALGSYSQYYKDNTWCVTTDQWGGILGYVLRDLLREVVAPTATPVVIVVPQPVPVVTHIPVPVTVTPMPPTPTPELTPTPGSSFTPAPTETVEVTPTPSLSATATPSPTATQTVGPTPTVDITQTLNWFGTREAQKTPSVTPTP